MVIFMNVGALYQQQTEMAKWIDVGESGLKSIVPDSTELISSQHYVEQLIFWESWQA